MQDHGRWTRREAAQRMGTVRSQTDWPRSGVGKGMGQPNVWPLIGPAALAFAGFLLRAAMPALADDSVEAHLLRVLRASAGVIGWLALAWAAARLFDILLLRAALAARRAPYSRLLSDMARSVIFVSAALIIAAQIFEQPAFGIVTTSGVVVAVIGFAL